MSFGCVLKNCNEVVPVSLAVCVVLEYLGNGLSCGNCENARELCPERCCPVGVTDCDAACPYGYILYLKDVNIGVLAGKEHIYILAVCNCSINGSGHVVCRLVVVKVRCLDNKL